MMRSSDAAYLVLACLTLVSTINSSLLKNLTKTIALEDGVNLMALTMQNTSLHYVLCYHMNQPQQKACILKTNSFSIEEAVKQEMKCPFTITVDKDYEMGKKMSIHQIKDHETVMVWGESHKFNEPALLKILVVSKPDCKMKPNKLVLDHKIPNVDLIVKYLTVLDHPHTHGLIYEDKMICNDKCYVIYDSHGVKYEGPSELNFSSIRRESGQFTYRDSSSVLSGRDRCIISLISEERLNASLFFTEEVDDLLADLKSGRDRERIRVSTTHGFLSLCKQEMAYTNQLECSRGALERWINFTFGYNVQDFVIHNLANGGILILTSKILETLERKNSFQFSLTRYDREGLVEGSVHVAYSIYCESPTDIHVHIYENEDGHYCVSLLEESTSLYLVSRCFSESSLHEYDNGPDVPTCGPQPLLI